MSLAANLFPEIVIQTVRLKSRPFLQRGKALSSEQLWEDETLLRQAEQVLDQECWATAEVRSQRQA